MTDVPPGTDPAKAGSGQDPDPPAPPGPGGGTNKTASTAAPASEQSAPAFSPDQFQALQALIEKSVRTAMKPSKPTTEPKGDQTTEPPTETIPRQDAAKMLATMTRLAGLGVHPTHANVIAQHPELYPKALPEGWETKSDEDLRRHLDSSAPELMTRTSGVRLASTGGGNQDTDENDDSPQAVARLWTENPAGFWARYGSDKDRARKMLRNAGVREGDLNRILGKG